MKPIAYSASGYALAVLCCFLILTQASQTDPSEVNALICIKKSLIDPKNNLRNWNSGDPCLANWTGVSCSVREEAGYFHLFNDYESLGKFSNPDWSFMWNNLTGTIPKEIGNILSLELLLLSGNKLSGSLPDELGNLSNLDRLQVDENQLSGQIPESFANMVKVKHLHMNNNTFFGQLPSKLSKLSNLVHLLVDNNNLSGYLPSDFSVLQRLRILMQFCNSLASYFKSQLDNNNFSGTEIPSSYENFSGLVKLDLSWNQFTGTIPSKKLANNMTTISLENNLLDGSIPASIWQDMAFNTKDKLKINLQNNSLSNILGNLNPPANVTLRLSGNPICENSNIEGIDLYCGPGGDNNEDEVVQNPQNPTTVCPLQDCQLSIYAYEDRNRITMYLKLFPPYDSHLSTFNESEVYRIKTIFTSWRFPPNHFFGPYELLNFTLVGPYAATIDSKRGQSNTVILVAALTSAVASILATSAIIMFLLFTRQRKYQQMISRKLKELALATNNFSSSTIVGHGGYGNVYKGILSGETLVAIKRAAEGSLQGQKEFLTEIELLSRLHHRNLVSLIGYCNEEEEQMLVYEFMPNGTLRDWISGKGETAKERQNFGMGLKIALGAAKGILYLHTEANPPIFHRDIKASNILLDSKFTAKVADFGLSLLASEESSTKYMSTVVKGTPGYLDPEYVLTHKFTDKSDIYSLGIVFLELLTGRQPILRGKHIVNEVNVACRSGMIYSVIESRMGLYPSDCLDKFLTLALKCCQENPEERPSALDVVRELEDIAAMLSETEAGFPDITLDNSGEMAPSSSLGSNAAREDQHKFTYVAGSNLVSGVVPTIVPR
ncbi:unnamed protein product [Sphenostylis stenocarpa]|uniref:non-specific serine/threonine protein kinase n=1 Tax=Sphenostylis stenocarpa TaxID=92480 RepID=A0AA86RQ75_9FABA|nr:unnamed protein product [Sphenostylis stenocarpa]